MIASSEVRAIEQRYRIERPIYKVLSAAVRARVERAAASVGLPCVCSSREKDPLGLLKKVLRKNYSGYENITDKAAARIVVPDLTHVEAAKNLVTSTFHVAEHPDETSDSNVQVLGYKGVHYLVHLPEGELLEVDGRPVSAEGLVCEVQIHTRAINLWSDATHDLLYKPLHELPTNLQRRLYRLVALVEIFDEQLAETLRYLESHPESAEATLLANLEPHFIRLAGMTFDRVLSLEILEALSPMFQGYDQAVLFGKIDQFVINRSEKLIHFYDEHRGASSTNPVALQPESILLLKEIEENSFQLIETWNKAYPIEVLDSIATTWGYDLELG